jgi:hypothetical protein
MSARKRARNSARKPESKPATKKSAKAARSDPNYYRKHLDEQFAARRKLCSFLKFWKFCGHKTCLRTHGCTHSTAECFDKFWPFVPELFKIQFRAGIEALSAGLPANELGATLEAASARWQEAQVLSAPEAAAAPAEVPAQTPVFTATGPRARVL